MVVCFFSYLFSICVLLGILTRSTVAALLLTLLAWFAVYAIGTAEQTVLMFQTMEKHGAAFAARSHVLAVPSTAGHGTKDKAVVIDVGDSTSDRGQSNAGTLEIAHRILHGVITVLPKTTETINLLQRWLVRLAALPREPASPQEKALQSAQREFAEALYRRSPFWIVGTSLAFEMVMLAWASWLLCRRDF